MRKKQSFNWYISVIIVLIHDGSQCVINNGEMFKYTGEYYTFLDKRSSKPHKESHFPIEI